MKSVYNHYNHCLGLATVHLVWIPCRRRKIFANNEELKLRCIQIFQSVANDNKWVIKAMEVAPDHVHLLVEYDPHHSISQVVKAFKGRIPRRADALYKASKINPTMSKGGFLSLELPCLRHALAFDLLPPECIPIPHRLTLQDTSRTRQCGMDIVS